MSIFAANRDSIYSIPRNSIFRNLNIEKIPEANKTLENSKMEFQNSDFLKTKEKNCSKNSKMFFIMKNQEENLKNLKIFTDTIYSNSKINSQKSPYTLSNNFNLSFFKKYKLETPKLKTAKTKRSRTNRPKTEKISNFYENNLKSIIDYKTNLKKRRKILEKETSNLLKTIS